MCHRFILLMILALLLAISETRATPSMFDEKTGVQFIDAIKPLADKPRRGLCDEAQTHSGQAQTNSKTIKEALGADLKSISVLWTAPFETRLRFQTAVDAISNALQTSPKQLYGYQPWANQVPPEFIAQLQYANGKTGDFEMAYGYACFQDANGAHWWTRFTIPSDINLAEVRGELEFKSGYLIHTRDGKEIWLRMVEDKILVRQLQAMAGKSVIARGQLRQIPRNITTSIPKGASYLDNGFTIELAP